MTQNTRLRQQRSGSRRSTLRSWSGLASIQTLIPQNICGGSWMFKFPNISLKTLITWRGSGKRSGPKTLLRCVQTWWPTTRNVWPLWLPKMGLPPSTILLDFFVVILSDDTTVIGLITDNDETAYREEVSTLTKWCQENHLSLNIDKTKELVVDYRRQSREHTPITIDKTPVERVSSFKFLGVHITEDLTWSAHTDAVLKKAHQRLFFLRRLRKFGTSPRILRSFYTCTVESILTGCITAWFGNSTAGNRRALQRVVRTAHHIVGGELPSLQDIYTRRCTRKARRIIKDSSHPSHRLLSLLPSGRRFRSIRSRTSRLRDSFFPQAIRLMNSHK